MTFVWRCMLATCLTGVVCGLQTASVWAQEAQADPAVPMDSGNGAEKPKVDSPLVVEPKTPEELFDAVVLMTNLARPEVAKLYLDKFMEGAPPDDLLLAMREKHGPSVFLKLSNNEELQPLSLQLLKRHNAAFARFARDPARLDALLKDLLTGTGEQRITAQHQMRTAGVHVVPALISALGNPAYGKHQPALVGMLGMMKSEAVAPLVAALTSPNPQTRHAVIQALGLIRDPSTIPYLLRFAGEPDGSEDKTAAAKSIARIMGTPSITAAQSSGVATRLWQQSRDHFQGKLPIEVGTDKLTGVWEWSEPAGTVVERRVTPAEAALHKGLFFAKAALDVAPDRQDVQTSYLTMLLAQEASIAGIGKPLKRGPGTLHDLAASLGADVVSRSLMDALELRQIPAALAALQVLAKTGSVAQVRTVSGKQSALQRALNYPSRRVQFAAVQTIVMLDPATRYPGADRVVKVLGKALTQAEASQPRGLVLDSVIERGQTITGFLRDLGYEPILVRTGTEGFKTAGTAQEIDLVLIDANIQRWALSETIANFKADPRTTDLPIVIYGSLMNERNVRIQVQQYRNVHFIQEPAASEDLRDQISRFMASQAEAPLSPEERSGKAVAASNMLSFLMTGQRRLLYDLTPIEPQLLTAVENVQLAGPLLPAVAALPTVAAQSHLASLAADPGMPVELRTLATRELNRHVRQHTLLISKEQVLPLNQAWSHATEGPYYTELSTLMGLLKPNAALIGARLRAVTTNQAAIPEPVKQ